MKEVRNALFDEMYVEDVLDNGLEVVVFHKPLYQTSACLFATPFGSFDCTQVDEDGCLIEYPMGVAHFLEHKLFESVDGDVMSQFAKLGASVNAFTSYDETSYFFTTVDGIEEPLNLLLDFVQSLEICEESVEKEKGIIQEERSLYEQDASSRMSLELYRLMYQNHPLCEDIVGTKESIDAIDVTVLKDAYERNYHPARMRLICVTPYDPSYVIELVRKNQSMKKFGPYKKVTRVVKDGGMRECVFTKLDLNLCEKRLGVGFKQEVVDESSYDRLKRDWCMKMCLDAYFTSVHKAYQSWLDEGLITPYFSVEEVYEEDYAHLLFMDEVEDVEGFKQFVVTRLEDCVKQGIQEDVLEQLKKRALGNFLTMFHSMETLASVVCRTKCRGISLFEEFDLVASLTVECCNQVLRDVCIEDCVVVEIV